MGKKYQIPEWFDEGVVLKASGLSARQVTAELRSRGHEVSHNNVWLHLWPAGRVQLRRKFTDEYRQNARDITRRWRERKKHAD